MTNIRKFLGRRFLLLRFFAIFLYFLVGKCYETGDLKESVSIVQNHVAKEGNLGINESIDEISLC